MHEQSNSKPLALSIGEASKRLGVGRSSLCELIASRQVRAFKIGTRTLIPETELVRFIEERMGANAP